MRRHRKITAIGFQRLLAADQKSGGWGLIPVRARLYLRYMILPIISFTVLALLGLCCVFAPMAASLQHRVR